MSRASALFITAALIMLAPASQAAALVASVDRTRLDSGETVTLTLESSDATQFGKPDLAPLNSQFEVRDTRQVNQLTTLGGNDQATTRWLITLMPRQTGSVVIPPLALGEVHSEAITLQVLQSEAPAADSQAPVTLEASLDTDNVYVQAQAVLTVRVYHSVSLYDDSSLSPLQLPDTVIQQLGDARTYEKMINGVRHGVIETRYALYPQHSGVLTIPALSFSATQVDSGTGQDASAKPGKVIQVSSPATTLTVKPKPDVYPADAPWLPTRSLTLNESWNPEPNQPQVGDSLTRTVTLKADGLSSAQLPPLPGTDVNGLRRYPDQPQLSNQDGERGLIGSRAEREALVPTRSGALALPSIDVVWWNTHEDHLEHSTLPARTLQVVDNPTMAVDAPANGSALDNAQLWPWQLSTVLLALTTLIGFVLWWRARSQPAVARVVQAGPSPRTLLDDLKRACLANDPQATRQALDAWARQQPETLADLAARYVPLSDALDGLNGALYSETGQFWQGEDLWRAIGTIPAADREQALVSDLPPLYPK
ncbi:MAG: BatD family protein [Pseudomonas sp.]|uniref:BatD family protein n=1 Tax=Pseudomonas abieticivorans TaxID=2931382 RepID=UPI0020BE560C|nr:BatD family protein [Pseudomonas sp. PIA16]MDE1165675.1 BatD family protein [Pseudomonas sp.]